MRRDLDELAERTWKRVSRPDHGAILREAPGVPEQPSSGLYEALITSALEGALERLSADLIPQRGALANAESADRVSRHLAKLVFRAIAAFPEGERAQRAVQLATDVLSHMETLVGASWRSPARHRYSHRGCCIPSYGDSLTATRSCIDRPLTPLLDTTVLTNAPGEPAVAHETRAEIPSADRIDVLMAFIRWSGVRRLIDSLTSALPGRQAAAGAHDHLHRTAQSRRRSMSSYDSEQRSASPTTRPSPGCTRRRGCSIAKSGYSTAYVGSSNLTHSAQVTGLEWNVRLAEARNPDALAKIAAVFDSYWASSDFLPYDPDEFRERTARR